jgi:DNA-binding response OmpR family regulator
LPGEEQAMEIKTILVVCAEHDSYWNESVKERLIEYGPVTLTNSRPLGRLLKIPYHLVLIDTEAVEDVDEVVRLTRSSQPDATILVFSSLPTWKQVRSAIEAGANDFSRKSFDAEEMLRYLSKYLSEG